MLVASQRVAGGASYVLVGLVAGEVKNWCVAREGVGVSYGYIQRMAVGSAAYRAWKRLKASGRCMLASASLAPSDRRRCRWVQAREMCVCVRVVPG